MLFVIFIGKGAHIPQDLWCKHRAAWRRRILQLRIAVSGRIPTEVGKQMKCKITFANVLCPGVSSFE